MFTTNVFVLIYIYLFFLFCFLFPQREFPKFFTFRARDKVGVYMSQTIILNRHFNSKDFWCCVVQTGTLSVEKKKWFYTYLCVHLSHYITDTTTDFPLGNCSKPFVRTTLNPPGDAEFSPNHNQRCLFLSVTPDSFTTTKPPKLIKVMNSLIISPI